MTALCVLTQNHLKTRFFFFLSFRKYDLTWAYLTIIPHPIRFHNALKPTCELVAS